MRRMKKKAQPTMNIKLYCLGCAKGCSPTSKPTQNYSGTLEYYPTIVKSRYLRIHLEHKNFRNCKQYYVREGLVSADGEKVDYTSSVLDQRLLQVAKKQKQEGVYTASDVGLTLTANGPLTSLSVSCKPISRTSNLNSTLNKQVSYCPFPSTLPRSLIETMDFESENGFTYNESDDCESNSDSDDNYVNSHVNIEDPLIPGSTNTLENECNSSISGISNVENHQIEDNKKTSETQQSSLFVIRKDVPLSGPSPQLAMEITLQNIIMEDKMAQTSFKKIVDWAKACQNTPGFDFVNAKSSRSREKIYNDINCRLNLPEDKFETTILNWLPGNKPTHVFHRSFFNALNSLLSNTSLVKEEHFSFPDKNTPFSAVDNSGDTNPIMEELHHGDWWSSTWESKCEKNSNEILVPIILYMDGVSIDKYGRLSLTPLNMTLGIFNVATRATRPDAWETIYWHPDKSFLRADHAEKQTGPECTQNLHNGLKIALQSFKDMCENQDGVLWNDLPYAGTVHKGVKMKFAIAYVVGDTEMHDRLCGRYCNYTEKVKKLCRHCDYQNNNSKVMCKPEEGTKLWKPSDFCILTRGSDPKLPYWKGVSHHPIKNAFDGLDFGTNNHGIHLATPGECLHMHMLGVAKRAIESFNDWVFCRVHEESLPDMVGATSRKAAFEEIGALTRMNGGKLQRQSDRDFPRTVFTSEILSASKKEGSDYAGILLALVITLSSDEGKHILVHKSHISYEKVDRLIHTYELILGMEEYLKHGMMRRTDIPKLERFVDHFIDMINKNCRGLKGRGTNLLKNHLYYHLPKYIEMWGPPRGWDSAPSESNHKTEIKAPARKTSQNANTFIEQTSNRITEKRMFTRATNLFGLAPTVEHREHHGSKVYGSKFTIILDKNLKSKMQWDRKKNGDKAVHPEHVLSFCCKNVLPLLTSTSVRGFTEHYRSGQEDRTRYLFRASPSYMSRGGQLSNVWYDWALFDDGSGGEGVPAQILCLLDITTLNIPEGGWGRTGGKPVFADGYDVKSNGQYAVVRKFKDIKENVSHRQKRYVSKKSWIVWNGTVDDKLYLYPCDMISCEVAVVQNRSIPESTNEFFVIRNRNDWLREFQQKIDDFGT